tara:strand:+ start:279 stop:1421 length:1143 start_codon:yes stop_codon:yes gene_type:complete
MTMEQEQGGEGGRVMGRAAPESLFKLPAEDIAYLRGRQVILSMSGGKDSTACALLLRANNVPFRAVFMDTGWEHPVTLRYVKEVLDPMFGVEVLTSEGMEALVERKGIFPSRFKRFCTDELKLKPFKRWLEGQYPDKAARRHEVVNVIGVRRAESARRSQAERWNSDGYMGIDVWRPLVEHSYGDVIAMHQAAGVVPNPLYLNGASRVGCFPCIYARKAEIAMVQRLLPERIDKIRELEETLSAGAEARAQEPSAAQIQRERAILRVSYLIASEGADIRWTDWKLAAGGKDTLPPHLKALQSKLIARLDAGEHRELVENEMKRSVKRTYFHGSTQSQSGIDEVVDWATGKGQIPLFDPGESSGCMRWGMCDLPADDGLKL